MKKFLSFICFFLVLSVSAQNQQNGNMRHQSTQQRHFWGQNYNYQGQTLNRSGQFSASEYARQQRDFFTKNAELTQDEADAFFPLYNELQQKKRELSREARRFMREAAGPGASDEQSLKAIDTQAEINIKIAELEKEYLQKFKEVLPATKILKVQNAQEQFNSQILKDIQQSRGHQFQQGQLKMEQQPQQRPQYNRFGHD